jgi:hypothetical protein
MHIRKTAALILALVVVFSFAAPVSAATGYGPGTVDSGSSSDSGYVPPAAAPSAMNPAPVTPAQVTEAVNTAIEQAVAAAAVAIEAGEAGEVVEAKVTLTNVSTVPASAIQTAFTAAATAGVEDLKINVDSKLGKTVLSRIYLDEAAATGLSGTVDLTVKTQGSEVNKAVKTFEKFYSNKVAAVSLGQKGAYGATLKMAVKADLSKLNTSTLVFYVYNKETNSFAILNTTYTIDANGYLHFSTPVGGDIIITDKPLSK